MTDKELAEKVEKIVAHQFDLVTNLSQPAYVDSVRMVAEQTIKVVAEEIKGKVEELFL